MAATVGVVTGAARGMGRACADRLVGTVDVLFLVDRDADGAAAAAAELGPTARAISLDITDRAAIDALVDQVRAAGELGPVAHAAGISPTMSDSRTIVDVDLLGSAYLVDALTPLVTSGTSMVCFASMAAHFFAGASNAEIDAVLDTPLEPELFDRLRAAGGDMIDYEGAAYGVAKRGVQRLVKRVSRQWGPRGGRINSISPGVIDTPMGRQEYANQPAMAQMVEVTPLGRQGTADELAAVAVFLLSDGASFVTGTDVLVDGGCVAAAMG